MHFSVRGTTGLRAGAVLENLIGSPRESKGENYSTNFCTEYRQPDFPPVE